MYNLRFAGHLQATAGWKICIEIETSEAATLATVGGRIVISNFVELLLIFVLLSKTSHIV